MRSGSLGMSLPHRQRSGIACSSSKRFKQLRRRRLHVCLVRCCHSRLQTPSLLGFCMHQHRHWRRRKEHWCCTYKDKCRELKLHQFLTPLRTGRSVWNRRRCMDSEFLLADCTLFHLHTEVGVIPDELLNKFVSVVLLSWVLQSSCSSLDTFFRGRCSVYRWAFEYTAGRWFDQWLTYWQKCDIQK